MAAGFPRHRTRRLVTGCLAVLLPVAQFVTAAAAAEEPRRGLAAADLVMMNRIADPRLSPDGRQLVFVLRSTDLEADAGATDLWFRSLVGRDSVSHRLTTNPGSDISPRWSADGKSVYFLSGRSGTSQIWVLPLDGGEARQVISLPVPAQALTVSPSGDKLAFAADVFPDCPDLDCTAARLSVAAAKKESGLVYDRLIMRFWDEWRDGRVNRLFVLPLKKNGLAAGKPVAVGAPLIGDVPEKPFGNSEAFAFSADGRRIFFALKRRGHDESWSINSDIFVANTDGSGAPENLTADNPAMDLRPVVSPDGERLAWLATEGPGRWAAEKKIMLRELKSGKVRMLAADWDRSAEAIAFAPDGRSILASADHLGSRTLWRISTGGERPVLLVSSGWVGSFSAADKRIVVAWDDLANPADLFEITRAGKDSSAVRRFAASGEKLNTRRLTAVNQKRMQRIEMGGFEQFRFAGAGGDTVYAYVVKPSGFEKGTRYPLVLMIHGGPHGSMGNHFHHRWNAQVLAGAGYGVLMIDYHGSTGYGQAFVESIMQDRGGKPLDDQKLGLAAALARYGWIDGERVCAIGGSFGGYLVSWIAGTWPDRFRCLVTHDGMFDNRMKYFTSDIIGYLEEGFGGTYFDNPEGHERFNPATLVDKWQTPMLVIHGGRDYRVPETQGIAAFTALQRKGVAGRFLYFPDENHWVLRPANSAQWYREIIGWLDRWLKTDDEKEKAK